MTATLTARPYVLAESALRVTQKTDYELAILPWGATEPHNLHLPYGTDSFQAEHVAIESARIAWEAGAKVIVLPTISLGANAQQLGTPLTINLNPSTQAFVLRDIADSLSRAGVRKLLLLNGHGGNSFKPMIRELQAQTDVFLCAADWYAILDAGAYFDVPGDHAGELETSMMQHLRPELVHPLATAGPGDARVFGIRGLREGWVWAPRDWARVTDDTGVGDPSASTPEKGAAYFEQTTRALGDFLIELANADLDDLYVAPSNV